VTDAVVVGGGHNGLVAANMLADHGWSVLVLEAQATPGGAVRSAELIEPGYVNDRCSAFYPLSVASPAMRDLGLEEFGLRWLRSAVTIAHPALDGSCPAICGTPDETASALGSADTDAWKSLCREWEAVGTHVVSALLGAPFPPVRAATRFALVRQRPTLLDFARLAVVPVRRLAEERFADPATRRLLAGLALHADLPPEAALSGFFGWLLAGLAQQHGFPVPAGGAQRITDALVARLHSRGGKVLCDVAVEEVVVRRGRAVAVRARDGVEYPATRAVLADVDAPQLYLQLLSDAAVPTRVRERIAAFSWDNATFKVDWNLDGPIPWTADAARAAGTVHVVDSVDALTMNAAALATHRIPAAPFLICGQQSMTDSSRQPPGKETAWAYTHVPQHASADGGPDGMSGGWDASEKATFADRVENQIEALAPGFRSLIRGRHITAPPDFTEENQAMLRGALNLGTAQLHQQLVFRPIPGLGRSETPIRGLFLASGSAHPGGGVHGACGANAARAALFHHRMFRWTHQRRSDA
jgi:phytoene dehydrogenase-like protein